MKKHVIKIRTRHNANNNKRTGEKAMKKYVITTLLSNNDNNAMIQTNYQHDCLFAVGVYKNITYVIDSRENAKLSFSAKYQINIDKVCCVNADVFLHYIQK